MKTFDGSDWNLDNEYIVDVMESPVGRPKNQELQREFYSCKKKKHTIKIQIVIEENTKKIVFVSFDKSKLYFSFKLVSQDL